MSDLKALSRDILKLGEAALAPGVIAHRGRLHAEVHQSAEPVPVSQAARLAFLPVEPGWRWGPVWSSAWFRLRGRVPPEMAGREVFLRFSSGSEALLWRDGVPGHGLDLNHDTAPIVREARGGEEIELLVEAACNRPLGATTFFWDDAAEVARWKEELPGRFEYAELVTIDAKAWRAHRSFAFAAGLIETLSTPGVGRASRPATGGACGPSPGRDGTKAPEAAALAAALHALLDAPGLRTNAGDAAREIERLIENLPVREPRTQCRAIGHAHIDTAWLWRLRETRRKCLRTFATALELLHRHPTFHFLCTQPQQYAWVEEDSPALFESIRTRIKEGRWEHGGAMWIEPDCNLPSGESFIRQVLHARRYNLSRFNSTPDYLFLPDTFGFPACLPQIMQGCGLKTFIFNKLSWNDTNEFPHSTFLWRGLDGTEILSHCTPGMEYNATNTPAELAKGAANHARKSTTDLWLQPFGFGDGGGGPTDWMIHNAALANICPALPRVNMTRVDDFCRELHERAKDLPTHSGELYLERHRGTYTTQAWIKRANRDAEESLRLAEILFASSPTPPPADTLTALDHAWKLTLLNQFHDILPGSSIGEVYADARGQYKEVEAACESIVKPRLTRPTGEITIYNPSSTPRSGVVEIGGAFHYAADIPSFGTGPLAARTPPTPVTYDGHTLRNGLIEAYINQGGYDGVALRSPLAPQADFPHWLGALRLYADNPKYWEAWDIDADYLNHPLIEVHSPWMVRKVVDNPLHLEIEVNNKLGDHSKITRTYTLDANSPRLDVHCRVDWHESRKLLRVVFPTGILSPTATYGTQFGHISRPQYSALSTRSSALFEVPAHRWMDLSEPGRGLAILTDCKYGFSCMNGEMGLTLLRSTKFPDEHADMGIHEFTYSLLPHTGDPFAANVDTEAESLCRPLIPTRGHHPPPFTLLAPLPLGGAGEGSSSPPRLEISAFKPAEPPHSHLILRLVETRGRTGPVRIRWKIPTRAVSPVNLIEEPTPTSTLDNFTHREGETTFTVRPFQIVTLMVERG